MATQYPNPLTKEKVAEALRMPVSEMDNEYKWIAETVQSERQKVTFCHNDGHGGNMMIGVHPDGSPDPSTYQLIDFDNAEFGFRAWDFEYYLSYWVPGPSDEAIDDFLKVYLERWNEISDEYTTLEELQYEVEHLRPYLLMEQMLFRRNRLENF